MCQLVQSQRNSASGVRKRPCLHVWGIGDSVLGIGIKFETIPASLCSIGVLGIGVNGVVQGADTVVPNNPATTHFAPKIPLEQPCYNPCITHNPWNRGGTCSGVSQTAHTAIPSWCPPRPCLGMAPVPSVGQYCCPIFFFSDFLEKSQLPFLGKTWVWLRDGVTRQYLTCVWLCDGATAPETMTPGAVGNVGAAGVVRGLRWGFYG